MDRSLRVFGTGFSPPLDDLIRRTRTFSTLLTGFFAGDLLSKALFKTSDIFWATTQLSLRRKALGISSKSFSFRSGIIIVLIPARKAAKDFSLSPPIGSTLPRKVISPVMATSLLTARFVSAEMSAVAMVIPADGPSLGIAPAGTCM